MRQFSGGKKKRRVSGVKGMPTCSVDIAGLNLMHHMICVNTGVFEMRYTEIFKYEKML